MRVRLEAGKASKHRAVMCLEGAKSMLGLTGKDIGNPTTGQASPGEMDHILTSEGSAGAV